MHLGARSSQRVEGTHWSIKSILNTPGKLSKLFKSIRIYLENEDAKAVTKHEEEYLTRLVIKSGDDIDRGTMKIMQRLYGRICQFAIFAIHVKIRRAKDKAINDKHLNECDCAVSVNSGLPCCHILFQAAACDLESFIIDPSTIDARWHLRTTKDHVSHTPIVDNNVLYANGSEDIRVQERFNKLKHDIATAYKDRQTSSQRIELLMALEQTLSGFVAVNVNDIYLPTDVKTKGRPKLTKGSRLPSLWEHAEAKQKKEAEKKKRKDVESTQDREENRRPTKRVRFATPPPYDQLYYEVSGAPFDVYPEIPKEYVTRVVDIQSDGWCGYRAIACHVTGNQDDAVSIKQAMLQQLLENLEFYEQNLWGGHKCITEEVLNRLRYQQNFGVSSCSIDYWMDAIIELPIAADAFNMPFAVYSTANMTEQPTLYLPHFEPHTRIRRSPEHQ
ncbi:hypothetical protein BJV82DRAFT_665383 [Fennellomyces sp. T-0311]|nr:hypothetical protein BJV82DRAFT_665383 [Fennellomyces sp. T-0311]